MTVAPGIFASSPERERVRSCPDLCAMDAHVEELRFRGQLELAVEFLRNVQKLELDAAYRLIDAPGVTAQMRREWLARASDYSYQAGDALAKAAELLPVT